MENAQPSQGTEKKIVLSIEEDSEFARSLVLGQLSPGNSPTSELNSSSEKSSNIGSGLECSQDTDKMLIESSIKSASLFGREENDEKSNESAVELRFLVRRREAGALIGKKGANIKRLRDTFRSSMFSIPDTGNGPERIVCIVTDDKSMDAILADFSQLLLEKSPENDEQIELKLLIHSSHAGSIIGIGGQSIKKLRNDSKAAIKIYEICCPLSNERVCAIKAKPKVVVKTIRLIYSIFKENPIKGTIKPYDALNFDLNLIEKYGGYSLDELSSSSSSSASSSLPLDHHNHFNQLYHNQHYLSFHQRGHNQPMSLIPQAYPPSYLAHRLPAARFNHRHLLDHKQCGSMNIQRGGYLSNNQNFSIWRAAPESSCQLDATHDVDKMPIIAGTTLIEPKSTSTVVGGQITKTEQINQIDDGNQSQPLLILKAPGRFQKPNFQQKLATFGPISNHNNSISRMNPYSRDYVSLSNRQMRSLSNPAFPSMNPEISFLQTTSRHQLNSQKQHQAALEQLAMIEEATQRCRLPDAKPYLCMFYPTLASQNQAPMIHHIQPASLQSSSYNHSISEAQFTNGNQSIEQQQSEQQPDRFHFIQSSTQTSAKRTPHQQPQQQQQQQQQQADEPASNETSNTTQQTKSTQLPPPIYTQTQTSSSLSTTSSSTSTSSNSSTENKNK